MAKKVTTKVSVRDLKRFGIFSYFIRKKPGIPPKEGIQIKSLSYWEIVFPKERDLDDLLVKKLFAFLPNEDFFEFIYLIQL
jgi:hypothetical protein